jgi:hypothetical protein
LENAFQVDGKTFWWTTKSSLISLIKFWKTISLLERLESCFCSFFGELFNRYLVMHPLW